MASFYAGLIHKFQHLTVSFLKYTKKTGLTFYQFLEAGLKHKVTRAAGCAL